MNIDQLDWDLPVLPDPISPADSPDAKSPQARELLNQITATAPRRHSPTRIIGVIAAAATIITAVLVFSPVDTTTPPAFAAVQQAFVETAQVTSGRFRVELHQEAGSERADEVDVGMFAINGSAGERTFDGVISPLIQNASGDWTPIGVSHSMPPLVYRVVDGTWFVDRSGSLDPGTPIPPGVIERGNGWWEYQTETNWTSVPDRLANLTAEATTWTGDTGFEPCTSTQQNIDSYCVTTTNPELVSTLTLGTGRFESVSAKAQVDIDQASGTIVQLVVRATNAQWPDIPSPDGVVPNARMPLIEVYDMTIVLSDLNAEIVIEAPPHS